jgi:hypothetical protein
MLVYWVAAAVGMRDELDIGTGAALVNRDPQGVQDKLGAHVDGELPADDPARVGVQDEREEHHALPAAQVGQIAHPEPIRATRGEVALDQIRAALSERIGRGRAPRLAAALGALDAVGAHQPLHAAATNPLAGAPQRLPHPSRAVRVVVGRVQLPDAPEQPLILDRACRALAPGARVVRGRRHVQDPADRLDAEARAVLIDERAHFGRSASSSFAKYTLADFKISFARRNS